MSWSFDIALANALLDASLRQEAWTAIPNVYLAWGDESGDELTNAEYQRQAIDFEAVGATTSSVSNLDIINFPQALTDWPKISYALLYNTAVKGTGDLLATGRLTLSRDITIGQVIEVLVGQIEITTGGSFSQWMRSQVLSMLLHGATPTFTDAYIGFGTAVDDDLASLTEHADLSRLPIFFSTGMDAQTEGLVIGEPGPATEDIRVTHLGIFNGASGNMMYVITLATPLDLESGDIISMPGGGSSSGGLPAGPQIDEIVIDLV